MAEIMGVGDATKGSAVADLVHVRVHVGGQIPLFFLVPVPLVVLQ
jgi:hypothetical protein